MTTPLTVLSITADAVTFTTTGTKAASASAVELRVALHQCARWGHAYLGANAVTASECRTLLAALKRGTTS